MSTPQKLPKVIEDEEKLKLDEKRIKNNSSTNIEMLDTMNKLYK